MSTLEDIMSKFWGDIMMHLGDTMSTLGGYHEYIRGCSVHRGVFSTLGDTLSTPEGS